MKYITVEDAFLLNAYRHECRGLNWIELGYDDRAAGSFRKAKKNYDKANCFHIADGLIASFQNQIENIILAGYKSEITFRFGK